MMTMQMASKDPEGQKRKEQEQRTRLESMTQEEISRLRSEEAAKRKKERVLKMKLNSQYSEEIKKETDQTYKEAVSMYEESAKNEVIAKMEVQRDLNSQKSTLMLRLAERNRKLQMRRSGLFDQDD